jgi:uncharacterized membrane protein YqjE
MDNSPVSLKQLASTTKQLVGRLLPIGTNRLELLMLEMQEARRRFLLLLFMACGIMFCLLLASITITALIVALFWNTAPLTVLISLSGLYLVTGFLLWRRLLTSVKKLQTLNATRDQLRKDRAAFDSFIS